MATFLLRNGRRQKVEQWETRRAKRRIVENIKAWDDAEVRELGDVYERDRIVLQLLSRDGDRCYLCGERQQPAAYEVDHIIPRSKGGTDQLSNFGLACRRCNGRKSDQIVSIVLLDRIPYFQAA